MTCGADPSPAWPVADSRRRRQVRLACRPGPAASTLDSALAVKSGCPRPACRRVMTRTCPGQRPPARLDPRPGAERRSSPAVPAAWPDPARPAAGSWPSRGLSSDSRHDVRRLIMTATPGDSGAAAGYVIPGRGRGRRRGGRAVPGGAAPASGGCLAVGGHGRGPVCCWPLASSVARITAGSRSALCSGWVSTTTRGCSRPAAGCGWAA